MNIGESIKAWIKRNIIDEYPELDETHAATRYGCDGDCLMCRDFLCRKNVERAR